MYICAVSLKVPHFIDTQLNFLDFPWIAHLWSHSVYLCSIFGGTPLQDSSCQSSSIQESILGGRASFMMRRSGGLFHFWDIHKVCFGKPVEVSLRTCGSQVWQFLVSGSCVLWVRKCQNGALLHSWCSTAQEKSVHTTIHCNSGALPHCTLMQCYCIAVSRESSIHSNGDTMVTCSRDVINISALACNCGVVWTDLHFNLQ